MAFSRQVNQSEQCNCEQGETRSFLASRIFFEVFLVFFLLYLVLLILEEFLNLSISCFLNFPVLLWIAIFSGALSVIAAPEFIFQEKEIGGKYGSLEFFLLAGMALCSVALVSVFSIRFGKPVLTLFMIPGIFLVLFASVFS